MKPEEAAKWLAARKEGNYYIDGNVYTPKDIKDIAAGKPNTVAPKNEPFNPSEPFSFTHPSNASEAEIEKAREAAYSAWSAKQAAYQQSPEGKQAEAVRKHEDAAERRQQDIYDAENSLNLWSYGATKDTPTIIAAREKLDRAYKAAEQDTPEGQLRLSERADKANEAKIARLWQSGETDKALKQQLDIHKSTINKQLEIAKLSENPDLTLEKEYLTLRSNAMNTENLPLDKDGKLDRATLDIILKNIDDSYKLALGKLGGKTSQTNPPAGAVGKGSANGEEFYLDKNGKVIGKV
jgi:hypothetical protein